jgi:hypothetical protein
MTISIIVRGAAVATALAFSLAALAQPTAAPAPASPAPAAPSVAAPAPAPEGDPQGVNPTHYQCYRVSPITRLQPKKLTLKDQFTSRGLVLGPVVSICAPVSKNGQPVKDERTHLTCYQVPAVNAGKKVRVQHQFGTQDLAVGGSTMVCLPSLKKVL